MRASRMSYPSEQADKYMLRMPDGLRDRIKSAAAENNRSMNAEILLVLEEKFPAPPPAPESLNAKLLEASEAIAERWADMLRAIGQDPNESKELTQLRATIEDAANARSD